MNEEEIIIIGANGQLGKALQAKYPNAIAVDSDDLDITDPQVLNNFDWSKVKVILNAAAYTNVDGAETSEGRLSAWKVNAEAVGNLVKIVTKNNLTLLHISTDYVFDGTKHPHQENESLSPLSVYGASKAAADLLVQSIPNHYILRTSWVIGDGKNFVRTMLELGKKGIEPSVVSDQVGRLTFTNELVRAIDHVLSKKIDYGIYNISNDGESVSWAEITRKIFEIAGIKSTVKDISTAEYFKGKSDIAPRPLQSTLDLGKLKATGFVPNDWVSDLSSYISKEVY